MITMIECGEIRDLVDAHGSVIGARLDSIKNISDEMGISGLCLTRISVSDVLYPGIVFVRDGEFPDNPDQLVDFYPAQEDTPGIFPVMTAHEEANDGVEQSKTGEEKPQGNCTGCTDPQAERCGECPGCTGGDAEA